MDKNKLSRILFFVILAFSILSAFFETEPATPTETVPIVTEASVETPTETLP